MNDVSSWEQGSTQGLQSHSCVKKKKKKHVRTFFIIVIKFWKYCDWLQNYLGLLPTA
jgi:hypothetical protein